MSPGVTGGAVLRLDALTLDDTNGIISLAEASSFGILNGVTITGGTFNSINDALPTS